MPVDAETRRCPYCGGSIPATAIKCRHCGSDLRSKTRFFGVAGGSLLLLVGSVLLLPVIRNVVEGGDVLYLPSLFFLGIVLTIAGSFILYRLLRTPRPR